MPVGAGQAHDKLSLSSNRKRAGHDFGEIKWQKRSPYRKADLFLDTYDDICHEFGGLSHETNEEARTTDLVDDVVSGLSKLDVQAETVAWNQPLRDLLDLQWLKFLSPTNCKKSGIYRAINLCQVCAILTFRDVLWYNNTLQQAASLKRFPICLVDMAYELKQWEPRRSAPQVSLTLWTSAWYALKVIWPVVVASIPIQLRRRLLHQRYATPPETCNWFEFNYFDGVVDSKEPLLCYYDSTEAVAVVSNASQAMPASTHGDCSVSIIEAKETLKPEEPVSIGQPTESFESEVADLQRIITTLLLEEDNGSEGDQK